MVSEVFCWQLAICLIQFTYEMPLITLHIDGFNAFGNVASPGIWILGDHFLRPASARSDLMRA